MPIVTQLAISLRNEPGALAELCSELAKLAVNISAIYASEAKPTGLVRLLVSHPDVARRVCDELRLPCVEERVVATTVAERPGALGKLTRKLAEKGINIEYLYGSIEKGSKRALLVFGVSDAEGAARVLK